MALQVGPWCQLPLPQLSFGLSSSSASWELCFSLSLCLPVLFSLCICMGPIHLSGLASTLSLYPNPFDHIA